MELIKCDAARWVKEYNDAHAFVNDDDEWENKITVDQIRRYVDHLKNGGSESDFRKCGFFLPSGVAVLHFPRLTPLIVNERGDRFQTYDEEDDVYLVFCGDYNCLYGLLATTDEPCYLCDEEDFEPLCDEYADEPALV